jgi:hypothetical protein
MPRPLVLALLAAPALAGAVEAIPVTGLQWKWMPAQDRRYYLETEVVLPRYIWFIAEINKEARVAAWQTRMVLDCAEIAIEGRRSLEVTCRIEDVAILAAALPGDQKTDGRDLLGPILTEMDENLSKASLSFVLRDDGRVSNVVIHGLDRPNRRVSLMNENLRQVLIRSVAGFDLELPAHGDGREGIWAQRESLLLQAPNQSGSFGGSETLHRVHEVTGDVAVIVTSGRGLVAPVTRYSDSPSDMFDTRIEGAAAFDTKQGVLTQRIWTVSGTPTASSALSEGLAGLTYYQHGTLRLLEDGEKPDVGASAEIAPPGDTAGTLTRWQPMGMAPEPSGVPSP